MKTLKVIMPGEPASADTTTVKVRKTGGRGTLKIYDVIKGVAIAGIAGAWIVLYQSIGIWLNQQPFDIIWEDVARSAVSGIMGYLSYNVFQKAKVVISAKELEA